MSTQYPGGFITKSPVAPTSSAASGIWTVDQALQYVKAGTWPTPPVFIEDLFSTYLFTGNALASQTITNNIDVSGKGGLVWIKSRNVTGSDGNYLQDTARGATSTLVSNSTAAATSGVLSSFTSSGFVQIAGWGTSDLLASWTFRKQPNFFDVVTYTGTGSAQNISHNLGSVPGCIIIKQTGAVSNWAVYHKNSNASPQNTYLALNDTAAAGTSSTWWNSTVPTSTVFTVGSSFNTNSSGGTYVAYLFASDAGGFPASGAGSTNGITCGSFTTDGSGNATVNLGYEPQWVIVKGASFASIWAIGDVMRGMTANTNITGVALRANATDAEGPSALVPFISSTGFFMSGAPSSSTYIYIAIRRGPMKVPTSGTSVFEPITYTGNSSSATISSSSVRPDVVISKFRSGSLGSGEPAWFDRLRGPNTFLVSSSSAVENSVNTDTLLAFLNQSYTLGADGGAGVINFGSQNYVNYALTRAPSFMDEVCYTGTGSATTFSHNLGVVPELMIVKKRSVAADWEVYHSALGPTKVIELNLTGSESTSSTRWNNTAPTASVFTVGTHTTVNASAATYVNYLFATLAGISKVGSFTGTAALQTLNCGFTTGARFVLIKRYDAGSTGDWYLWDSARGISSSTDPYFLMNSSAAETTGTNYVDTTSTGFQVTAAASTTVNISAATYIFLAIA